MTVNLGRYSPRSTGQERRRRALVGPRHPVLRAPASRPAGPPRPAVIGRSGACAVSTGSASTGPGSPMRRPSWSRDTTSAASRRSWSVRAWVSSSTSCSESLCTAAPDTTRARATPRPSSARRVRSAATRAQLLVLEHRVVVGLHLQRGAEPLLDARSPAALSSSALVRPEVGELADR